MTILVTILNRARPIRFAALHCGLTAIGARRLIGMSALTRSLFSDSGTAGFGIRLRSLCWCRDQNGYKSQQGNRDGSHGILPRVVVKRNAGKQWSGSLGAMQCVPLALASPNVLFQGLSVRAAIGAAIIIIGLGSLAKAQSLQEQEMCAKQAPNALQYWKEKDRDQQSDDYWFQDHYNTRLKKCFVNIRYNKSTFSAAVLMDAYEYRTYAAYFEMSTQKSNFRCDLMPSSLEKKSCSSKKEFDAFVSKYMEE